MFNKIVEQFSVGLRLLILFTVITGIIYPFFVTGTAQLLFPWQANGSMLFADNTIVGSQLIGQSFTAAKYFWGRPSATTPVPYNATMSSGSNIGPTNPQFLQTVKDRIAHLQAADVRNFAAIPVGLVTASGSGLDPEISPAAAFYQIHRISAVRHLPEKVVRDLVEKHIQQRQFGVLGEPRVNVLQLNIALDNLSILVNGHW